MPTTQHANRPHVQPTNQEVGEVRAVCFFPCESCPASTLSTLSAWLSAASRSCTRGLQSASACVCIDDSMQLCVRPSLCHRIAWQHVQENVESEEEDEDESSSEDDSEEGDAPKQGWGKDGINVAPPCNHPRQHCIRLGTAPSGSDFVLILLLISRRRVECTVVRRSQARHSYTARVRYGHPCQSGPL